MANYYHEARAQVKKIKEMQAESRRNKERREEVESAMVGAARACGPLHGGRCMGVDACGGHEYARLTNWTLT